jgi:hypothetical protein
MYRGRPSLYELSPTFSNTSKGIYCRALIFLPGPYSISLFSCNHTLSPTLNVFSILCWSCLALYFSCDLFSVSSTCKWILLIFSTFFSTLSASHVRSSLTPPCCPYTTSKGEGGKYPKQVSKGDLPEEVWTTLS